MTMEIEEKLAGAGKEQLKQYVATCKRMKSEGYTRQDIRYSKLTTASYLILLPLPFAMLFAYYYVTLNLYEGKQFIAYCLSLFIANMCIAIGNVTKGVTHHLFSVFLIFIVYSYAIMLQSGQNGSTDYFLGVLILSFISSVALTESVHRSLFSVLTNGKRKGLLPLTKGAHLSVALFSLSLVLMIAALSLCMPGEEFYMFAQMMLYIAGYDMLVLLRLLTHRVKGADVRYLEHPSGRGFVAFVKNEYQK